MSTSNWEKGNTDYFVPMIFILLKFTLNKESSDDNNG